MYIDSHTHFDIVMDWHHSDENTVIKNLKDHEIIHSVQVAIDTETSQWSYDFAKRNRDAGVLFTLGIHPSSYAGKKELTLLTDMVSRVMKTDPDIFFGIGECGLDYFRMKQQKSMQIEGFSTQIVLAKQYDLPLIIHIRDAFTDALELLKPRSPVWGIMHCFPGDRHAAQKALDLGFYISFAGNLTYKNAHILHDTAKYVPMDHILLETDAPFLSPIPLRGKKNKPEYVIHTYEYIAALKGTTCEKVKEKVYENFSRIKNRGKG
ncbi:MAG: TatD family hydrolase [Spirochaetales bacterium]|nr:TatD family hydrolase [Spirochaetales bacterium]